MAAMLCSPHIENGRSPSHPSQTMRTMIKTVWRWGRDVAFSVPLLLMLPSAISFCKFLSFVNQILFGIPINVKGDVVLVTGASSGIGQCIAKEYAKRGANLVLVARREHRLQEVAEECKVYGAEDALVCSGDLTNPDDCKKIVDFTIASFGRLNVLVNNAGIAGGSLFEEYKSSSQYKKILASKSALLNFFETLRIESIGTSITITIAFPGFIHSELTAKEAPGKVPWWFPLMRTEDAAEAIVKAALRKKRQVITPSWYSAILWWKFTIPEILEWIPRVFILGKPPTTTIETMCNVLLGKSDTQSLFERLKLS